jgi:hypothetical protein
MQFLKTTFAVTLFCAATGLPTLAQEQTAPAVEAEATTEAEAEATAGTLDPNGTFVDEYGTSFTFALCGDGTALCGVLNTLEGESATEENLAYVGKQVMQAEQSAPNEWQGSLSAGGLSAEATVTQTGPDTIDIRGCRAAILCQTLTYVRADA